MLLEAVAFLLYLAVSRLLAVFLLFISDLYDAFGFPPALGFVLELLPSKLFNFWPRLPDEGLWLRVRLGLTMLSRVSALFLASHSEHSIISLRSRTSAFAVLKYWSHEMVLTNSRLISISSLSGFSPVKLFINR